MTDCMACVTVRNYCLFTSLKGAAYLVTPRIHRHAKSEIAVTVVAAFPDFQEWCRLSSTERDTTWLIWFLFFQKDVSFSEYLAHLDRCCYVRSRAFEILLLFIRCWTRTLTIILQLSFTPNIFRSEGFITQACRSNRKCYYQKFYHNLDLHLIGCFLVCRLQATTSGTAGLALV